jgi:arsenate reductase
VTAPRPPAEPARQVLFLCTGNSARSILAEAILNSRGAGLFRAHSAGSDPAGRVHPLALDTLARMGLPTDGLRSKRWDEFTAAGALPLDLVITVCDRAAAETCPVWPGGPLQAHWGLPDPAAVVGDEQQAQAFRDTYAALGRRIDRFLELPFTELDAAALQERVQALAQD